MIQNVSVNFRVVGDHFGADNCGRMRGEMKDKLVRVTFLPEGRTVEFNLEDLPYQQHGLRKSILDVALNFNINLDHACGGNCACTTCHVVVRKGEKLLSEMQDEEADKLDEAADLQLHSRLGCQCQIVEPGDIVVEVPAWNRNYVSEAD